MKAFAFVLGSLVTLVLAVPAVAQQPQPTAEKAEATGPKTVAVLGEPGNYQVPLDQIIRISPDVVAGGSIKVKATGPIKQSRRVNISQLVAGGGGPLIGQALEEFEFKASEAGKATITVTKEQPTSDQPETLTYNITIIVN